jgi:DNA-binding LacI/PurR family transcriptional regulator
VPPEYIRHADEMWTPENAGRHATGLIALDPAPTAIITADDRQAVGVLRALRAAGKRVPDDIALVCLGVVVGPGDEHVHLVI